MLTLLISLIEKLSNKVGDNMTDLELRHYGVKGMKWGVRKNRSDIPTDKESKNLEKNNKKDNKKTRKKSPIV